MSSFVSVNNIDNENKKFRLIISKNVRIGDLGDYNINVPFPTSITNSNKYNQCLIKLETINIECVSAPGTANPNPVWCSAGAAVGEAVGAIVLNANFGSKNSLHLVDNSNAVGQTDFLYTYQELIPLKGYFRGNYQGIEPATGFTAPNMPPQPIVDGNSYQYVYSPPKDEGVVCGNPFGTTVNFYFSSAWDHTRAKIYLSDVNNPPPSDDLTQLSMSFTIELLEGK